MTEQELREKIIELLKQQLDTSYSMYELNTLKAIASQVHILYKQANYVRLADDQSLPKNKQPDKYWVTHPHFETAHDAVKEAQDDMKEAGFRKVEL